MKLTLRIAARVTYPDALHRILLDAPYACIGVVDLEQERLAFPVHKDFGEVDYGIVYAKPSDKLMQVLEENTEALYMYLNCLLDSIFEYKRATIEDIDELVKTRIIVLSAANKLSDDVDMSLVEKESYAYYKWALEPGEHIAYLVYDNDRFIGAGGVSFYQVMPTYHNPSGKKAYIMNMYTAPEYRRQGIALHTLDLLVKDAKERGVSQIALEATEMGRPLYERYGKEMGDFGWGIAYHPYPEDLNYPDFYNDRIPKFYFDTKQITFKNMEVLHAYLEQEDFLYQGQRRPIVLSEQGFNSRQDELTELQGAAGYILAYQKMKRLPGILWMTHHAYMDNPKEFGLHLGIRERNEDGSPGRKRPIYEAMRDMGTEKEAERVAWARGFIGEALYRQLECPAVHACDEDRSKEMDF